MLNSLRLTAIMIDNEKFADFCSKFVFKAQLH